MAKKAKAEGRKPAKRARGRKVPQAIRVAKQKPDREADPLTVNEYVRIAARRLERAGVVIAHGTTDPFAEAAFFVGEALGLGPETLGDAGGERVSADAGSKILGLVEERIRTRKPAAYLLNKIYMRGLPFYVDERTIVPRSYIGEVLDEHFDDYVGLQLREPWSITRVLDLCTGSGCLAILAAYAFPNAMVDAADLSRDALDVAKRNVADHGLKQRIRLVQGDLFAPVGGERYDLIISNPPYVDAAGMASLPPECEYEPRMAFDGGADGIDLVHRILSEARAHLNDGGGLLCEVGRCRPALETAYPRMPFLWLDTEESEGEVFWLDAKDLSSVTGLG